MKQNKKSFTAWAAELKKIRKPKLTQEQVDKANKKWEKSKPSEIVIKDLPLKKIARETNTEV